jgi:predicted metal-binding protein
LILICEKCGQKLAKKSGLESAGENVARQLHAALKAEIAASGERGSYRAVVASCMNLCPEGLVTAAIARIAAPEPSCCEFYAVEPANIEAACLDLLARARAEKGARDGGRS